MFADILGMSVFIVTLVLVSLLVAGRFLIRRYGQRIGADEADFDHRPGLERERSQYKALKRGYAVVSILLGLCIIFFGTRLLLSAWTDIGYARRRGLPFTPSQIAGAFGAVLTLAGMGVIIILPSLRWDHHPDRILNPRRAFKAPAVSGLPSRSGADFSALTDAYGDTERAQPPPRWYNAHPGILWVMVGLTASVFLCYLALFVLALPGR